MLVGPGVTTAGLIMLERGWPATTKFSGDPGPEEGTARDDAAGPGSFYEAWDDHCPADGPLRWSSPWVAGSA